jgi:MFS family permease
LFSPLYRRYVLLVLTFVSTLNYLDQGLISLLLQPIKNDLHLSDSQLGFLTGIAFALFYATLGLPIARWADRGNRSTITSLAIALWGATVMLCLWVTNFAQLVLARVAAGVGESGCMPPTYSLVGDYFPQRAERTRAMAFYWMANAVAALISFILGGRLNEIYGWRLTFFIMGTPALLAAVLVKLTVAEPRVSTNRGHVIQRPLPGKSEVARALWRQRSTRHLIFAIVLLYTIGAGLSPWYAAFMMRSHGMSTSELGVWLGSIFGLSGIAGILIGGYVAGRWFANNERGQMRLSAIMIALVVPFFMLFLLLPRKHEALIALIPLSLVFSFFTGPTFALMQRLVVDEMRATTLAVTMLLANLIGMGIGPQIVGTLSDLLNPTFGSDSLRYAMLLTSFVALWAAYHFWQVGRTVREDLLAVPQNEISEAVAEHRQHCDLSPVTEPKL